LFRAKPSKEVVLATLQSELERQEKAKKRLFYNYMGGINYITNFIEAVKLWDGTTQNIHLAGVWIAELKWLSVSSKTGANNHFYEVE